MNDTRLLTSLTLLALAVGCENLEERAQYLTGPEAIVWGSDQEFTVREEDDMTGYVNATSSTVKLYLSGFPPGTEAAMGERTVTVGDNGAGNIEVESASLFGGASTEDFLRAQIDGLTLELQPPGRDSFSIPLPAQEVAGAYNHLLTIVDGPVRYAGEEATAAEHPATIYWPHGASHELIGAPAATFAAIDAIAITDEVVTGTRVCEGYQGSDGRSRDLTLELVEHVVTLYDRRTGTSLSEQRFPPIDRCPGSSFSFRGEAFRTQTVLPEDAIRSWLETRAAE